MKKILAWPAPLLQKWLLSLLLCLPFLAAAIVSAFSGDRTFLILSALLFAFCGVRCAELYVMLANERYCAEEGICLSVSSIPFQRQRRVALQKADGEQLVFCIEKEQAAVCGGKRIGSICWSVQLSMKLRTHICRSPVRWPWRKLKQRFLILLRSQLKMLQILLDNFVRFYCTFRSIRI